MELEECERAHALTTITTGSKESQKGSQQSDKQLEQCSVLPEVPSLQIFGPKD